MKKVSTLAQVIGTVILSLLSMGLSARSQTLPRVDPEEPVAPSAPLPEVPTPPEELLPPTEAVPPIELPPEVLATEIVVTALHFEDNQILNDDVLRQAILNALAQDAELDARICDPSAVSWSPRSQTVAQLLRFAEVVAFCYAQAGYTTAGAIVQIPPETQDGRGPITIAVKEGSLESVSIIGTQRLGEAYIRSRLGVRENEPLNVANLQERLQLLQTDPLIRQVQAILDAGVSLGSSQLVVQVDEARSWSTSLAFDNSRPPSVGTHQRQIFLREANLLGIGDSLSLGYTNSKGSDALSLGYTVPVNAEGGTLSLRVDPTWNDIVDSDFFDINRDGSGLDIQSRSQLYEISLRQPVIRQIREQTFQEFAVGLSGSLRNSQSFFLDEPAPLAPGASVDGKTRVSAVHFFQEYRLRDRNQILLARSQFNLGLDLFDATVNSPVAEVGAIPDSRFFSWQGQVQWTQLLAQDTLLLFRSSLQLADQGLLSSEQFSLGGFSTVRGYRQDQVLTDNGFLASAEARIPVLRLSAWDALVQVTPFVDFGTGWNSGDRSDPDESTLASVGLGLQLLQGDRNQLSARLDWGIPLISVDSGSDTWQENGVYFSVVYTPF